MVGLFAWPCLDDYLAMALTNEAIVLVTIFGITT